MPEGASTALFAEQPRPAGLRTYDGEGERLGALCPVAKLRALLVVKRPQAP